LVRDGHVTPRYPVSLWKKTHAIFDLQSKSRTKIPLKVQVSMAIDLCDENNLVNRNRGFLLADLEEVMVGERELSQISGWNTVFVDSQDTIDKLQILADRSKISKAHIMDHLARLIRDNNLFSRYGKKTLRELIDSSKKETLKYEPENGERDKYDNPYYDDWSEEKKKFVRETERTAVFHDWEELKKEYPMFGKRLIHDEVFAKEARMAKSMYYLRNIARDADELSVLVTHVFRCELSGLEIKVNPFPHSFCPSGKGAVALDVQYIKRAQYNPVNTNSGSVRLVFMVGQSRTP